MTATPCAAAFSATAEPVPESRLTITSTETPAASMPSAMVWNLALSPLAFWMSYSTPAPLKASSRKGRSAVSQRAEDAVSGRITPTLPAGAAAEDEESEDEAAGVSDDPQPVRVMATAESPATTAKVLLRMGV